MSSLAINPLTSATGAAGGTSSTASPAGSTAPSEQMFLQLLVAQIKNQDPTSPSDPSQFVGELAQFSQLEQVIGIHQDLDSIKAAGSATQSTPPAAGN